MSIVRTGFRGRRSGLRGRLRGLGQDVSDQITQADITADALDVSGDNPGVFSTLPGLYGSTGAYSLSNPLSYGTSAVPGSISPQDAALLSSAITAAGKVGTQAIIGTPTVTYNPTTGTYMATGGAAIPSQAIATSSFFSSLDSYLPLILLFGGVYLVLTMGKR